MIKKSKGAFGRPRRARSAIVDVVGIVDDPMHGEPFHTRKSANSANNKEVPDMSGQEEKKAMGLYQTLKSLFNPEAEPSDKTQGSDEQAPEPKADEQDAPADTAAEKELTEKDVEMIQGMVTEMMAPVMSRLEKLESAMGTMAEAGEDSEKSKDQLASEVEELKSLTKAHEQDIQDLAACFKAADMKLPAGNSDSPEAETPETKSTTPPAGTTAGTEPEKKSVFAGSIFDKIAQRQMKRGN